MPVTNYSEMKTYSSGNTWVNECRAGDGSGSKYEHTSLANGYDTKTTYFGTGGGVTAVDNTRSRTNNGVTTDQSWTQTPASMNSMKAYTPVTSQEVERYVRTGHI
jgi:hypothetical protein